MVAERASISQVLQAPIAWQGGYRRVPHGPAYMSERAHGVAADPHGLHRVGIPLLHMRRRRVAALRQVMQVTPIYWKLGMLAMK